MFEWLTGSSSNPAIFSGYDSVRGLASKNNVYDTSFWSPEQWQQFGAMGGTVDGNKLMFNGAEVGSQGFGAFDMSSITPYIETAGLVGNLAMTPYKMDLYKEQIGALKDQRAYNKEMLENHRTFNKNIGAGLASAFSK